MSKFKVGYLVWVSDWSNEDQVRVVCGKISNIDPDGLYDISPLNTEDKEVFSFPRYEKLLYSTPNELLEQLKESFIYDINGYKAEIELSTAHLEEHKNFLAQVEKLLKELK